MLDVIHQDYVRTGHAKGLSENTVYYKHALKNAAAPVVTNIGFAIATKLGGSAVMETVFNIPGVGKFALESLNRRDYDQEIAIILFVSVLLIFTNILLDIVYNDMEFRKYNYEDMCTVASTLGLQTKEKAFVIETWQEFFDWYYNVTDEDYEYNGRKIEGFVIEDSNGYMVKLKLQYYNFWKFMRAVSHEAIRFGYIRKTAALTTALANQYYGWVRTLHGAENPESVPKDICTLRRMFFESEVGKAFKAE